MRWSRLTQFSCRLCDSYSSYHMYREGPHWNYHMRNPMNNSSDTSTLNYVFDNKYNSVWISHVLHLFEFQATTHCLYIAQYAPSFKPAWFEITICASFLYTENELQYLMHSKSFFHIQKWYALILQHAHYYIVEIFPFFGSIIDLLKI